MTVSQKPLASVASGIRTEKDIVELRITMDVGLDV